MIIPKDVSGLRRKFAQALVLRKRGTIPPSKPGTVPPRKPAITMEDLRAKKAREEAIKSRHELRERSRMDAEKDVEIQELRDRLLAAEKLRDEYEPQAKRWNEYAHKEKERMIAKLPKEVQREARDMDVKHLALFVNNYPGAAIPPTGTVPVGTGIKSLEDATKADTKTYNKFMDDIKTGAVKVDAKGLVIA